ncbi:hypothetical protein PINS_up000035 [Pythium insidiosum]|nr:hypothetical protein PINS_up000035 [Pythium insidiosum]
MSDGRKSVATGSRDGARASSQQSVVIAATESASASASVAASAATAESRETQPSLADSAGPPASPLIGPADAPVVKRNQSKYDFVKVRVWVQDHFYVLSRYLLSRALVSTKVMCGTIKAHHASKEEIHRQTVLCWADQFAGCSSNRTGPQASA